jgi:UDP-galactopyranose mutase
LERPVVARADDSSPLYTSADPAEEERHAQMLRRARRLYPKMEFLGRLATYRYLDMTDAVQAVLRHLK